jgi:hypothetical protein
MTNPPDRLYDLLPAVYRIRDYEQGQPLRALLQVIAEQIQVVEDDIWQLYDNWFIETCQDWVVPYIADLVGFRLPEGLAEPSGDPQRDEILRQAVFRRRDVGDLLRARRRKGSLALLEELSQDVAGWPARAVEFYHLLGWTQALNFRRLRRGRTVDLRDGDALDLLGGPFEKTAHGVDVRRINSAQTPGRYNIPNVGLFVWRLKPYPVTRTAAYCLEEEGPQCYTFSVLGNDTPLFNRPRPEPDTDHIADESNVPVPIRRRVFEVRTVADAQVQGRASEQYYGLDVDFSAQSVMIWVRGGWPAAAQATGGRAHRTGELVPIGRENVIPADLSDWTYRPPLDCIAVDPRRGRIIFPSSRLPKQDVVVSYYYGFSGDIGGGEYDRPISQVAGAVVYRLALGEPDVVPGRPASPRSRLFTRLSDALEQWLDDQSAHREAEASKPAAERSGYHAVIEVTSSGVIPYEVLPPIEIEPGGSLQIRAANRTRPVLWLVDARASQPDSLRCRLGAGSRLVLDGLLIAGRGVHCEELTPPGGTPTSAPSTPTERTRLVQPAKVVIRHCTLVPG